MMRVRISASGFDTRPLIAELLARASYGRTLPLQVVHEVVSRSRNLPINPGSYMAQRMIIKSLARQGLFTIEGAEIVFPAPTPAPLAATVVPEQSSDLDEPEEPVTENPIVTKPTQTRHYGVPAKDLDMDRVRELREAGASFRDIARTIGGVSYRTVARRLSNQS